MVNCAINKRGATGVNTWSKLFFALSDITSRLLLIFRNSERSSFCLHVCYQHCSEGGQLQLLFFCSSITTEQISTPSCDSTTICRAHSTLCIQNLNWGTIPVNGQTLGNLWKDILPHPSLRRASVLQVQSSRYWFEPPGCCTHPPCFFSQGDSQGRGFLFLWWFIGFVELEVIVVASCDKSLSASKTRYLSLNSYCSCRYVVSFIKFPVVSIRCGFLQTAVMNFTSCCLYKEQVCLWLL